MRAAWKGPLAALLWVTIVVCIAALSTRFGFTQDWSAGRRASITPQSQALLATLKGPLRVTSYARPGALRAKTRLLIQRYRRFKPDLSLRFVDPDAHPIATEDAHITVDGELVLDWRGRRQTVTRLDEPSLSDALARLARGGPKLVAFVTGDGERRTSGSNPASLGRLVRRLASRGVRALPLDLADAAEVPRNADLVVLASPQAALLPASVQKLEDYVGNGGNLLWLTEPGSDGLGLDALARSLGIKRLPGTLVDAPDDGAGGTDPPMLVASHYPAQAITDGFDINTLFPRATALAAVAGAAWHAQPILESGPQSWNRIGPAAAGSGAFEVNAGELRGPLSFGYALSRISPSPDKNQQRVVVIGDGDFLSNRYLADAGNLAFGERVFNWLLGDDALASVPPVAPDTILKPTRIELDGISYGYLIVLPLVLIGLGWAIQWRRRRR